MVLLILVWFGVSAQRLGAGVSCLAGIALAAARPLPEMYLCSLLHMLIRFRLQFAFKLDVMIG